jgi:hypothetical protein
MPATVALALVVVSAMAGARQPAALALVFWASMLHTAAHCCLTTHSQVARCTVYRLMRHDEEPVAGNSGDSVHGSICNIAASLA